MWLLSKEVKSRLINIGIWYDPYSEWRKGILTK
jgi:hypothetical protein